MGADDVFKQIESASGDIVIRAGAGTGKTTALVMKYLSELSAPREEGYATVDRLCAITFTVKAAGEMSDRVREKLTEKIDELSAEAPIEGSSANLSEDDPQWSEKSKLLAHLVRQRQTLKSAYISTIHSFCARLLWENPVAAGVDPAFVVMDETDAKSVMERAIHKVILDKLRAGAGDVKKLVADYGFSSKGRVEGLKNYILRMIPLIRAANIKLAGLERIHVREISALKQKQKGARMKLKNLALKLLEFGKASREKKFADALSESPKIIEDGSTLDPVTAGKFLKMAEELRKGVQKRKSVISGKEKGEEAYLAADLAEAVCGHDMEIALLKNSSAMTRLIKEIQNRYEIEKLGAGALDYDDLEEKTRDLLKKSPRTLNAYRKRFYRALIDEFQDTNMLQMEIVTLLAPPGEGRLFIVGDSKQSIYGFRGADINVFEKVGAQIVENGGDQFSLTKSRRSTPALVDFTNRYFETLMRGGKEEEKGRQLRFNIDTDRLKPVRPDENGGFAVTRIGTGGEEEGIDKSRLVEAGDIADYIKWAVSSGEALVGDSKSGGARPVKFGDIAILLRTFTSHEVYESALRRSGSPYQVVKGRGFYDSQEIKDISNLLSFLDYSSDALAYVSVLRSPLAGLSDSALLTLCVGDKGDRLDPVKFIRPGEPLPLFDLKEDAQRFETFRDRLSQWKAARDRMTISELIETIISQTGYGAVMTSRFNGEQYLGNIFKLIELARTFEMDGSRGLKNFIVRLKAMIAREPGEAKADISGGDEDVVRIMTTHQSKGLEFPVVIIADIASSIRSQAGKITFHPEGGLGLQHYDLASGKWYAGPIFRNGAERAKSEQTQELKRLLYVAMTRARDRLVLSGAAKRKGVWQNWIDETIEEAGLSDKVAIFQKPAVPDISSSTPGAPPLVDRLLAGYRPDAAVPGKPAALSPGIPSMQISVTSLASFSLCPRLYYYRHVMEAPMIDHAKAFSFPDDDERSRRETGIRVHEVLEQTQIGEGAPENALKDAVNEKFLDFSRGTKSAVLKNLATAFGKPPLSALRLAPPGAIMREVSLVHKIVEKEMELIIHGAADIIWFDGNEWNMVDYKYSARPVDERGYLFQLKLYAHAMMTAHRMKSLNTAVVYLKEKKDSASTMRFLPIDAPDLRDRVVNMARRLLKLEKKPEREWPMRERKSCDEYECFFRSRCY